MKVEMMAASLVSSMAVTKVFPKAVKMAASWDASRVDRWAGGRVGLRVGKKAARWERWLVARSVVQRAVG